MLRILWAFASVCRARSPVCQDELSPISLDFLDPESAEPSLEESLGCAPNFYILRGCAHGRAAHAEARGEQFLSMLRPLNSLKISKR